MPGPLSNQQAPLVPLQMKWANYKDRQYLTAHANCQNGANCTGPGCRIYTGKTRHAR